MYILNGKQTEIVNSEFVERFCAVEKPDAGLIVASYGADRPPVTLARYKDMKETMKNLGTLFGALADGQYCFVMPESLMYCEQATIKDARTRRKGGS